MKVNAYVVGMIGTNCYLVWDEESREAMLVDPGGYDAAISRTVADEGLTLKYIALTHGHGDHVDGVNDFVAEFPETRVAMSEADMSYVSDTDENISGRFFGRKIMIGKTGSELYLKDGDRLMLGDICFKVISVPGHTPGGLAFYAEGHDAELVAGQAFSGTVFSGDTLFHLSVGRTDLIGGDAATLAKSIKERLFTLPDDTLVLPGHMDATTIETEKRHNPFV
ncbi:MAG: MBL fold metallo-hydrolase [Clostridiales bacterium]|nr:MBL fold metallo-hydrolase [Clostridiales bacterium]